MSIVTQNLSIWMARPHLNGLPPAEVPAGFRLRRYRPGDADAWVRIHLAADRYNRIDHGLFAREFGDEELLADRQLYLVDSRGTPVGTATAWFDDDVDGSRWGRIHWVAVLPALQGRGLGRLVLAAAMARLRELGHERARLATSTGRVSAVRLYWSFGFRPVVGDAQDAAVWEALRAAAGLRDDGGLDAVTWP
jgi:GNAT superfamily N-acetyltransferase